MSISTLQPTLIGHQWALQVLDNAAREGRVRHAYLFHGPSRVGKSTAARWFAAHLNCERAEAPCGQCDTCARILRGRHPDVRSLQAAADHDDALGLPIESDERSTRAAERSLSISQIRALQHDAALSPNEAPWKVYVVVGAEAMTLPAANALLKTLEEPPDRVVVILTVSNAYDLLPTIVSRCQTLRFGLVPVVEISTALESEHDCPPERAALLARLSGGRPGWAIEGLVDDASLTDRARLLDELEPTISGGFRERLTLAEKLASGYSRDPNAVQRALATWRVWWWDVCLIQRDCAELVTNIDRRDGLERLARSVPADKVADFVRRVGDASLQLAQNDNPRLALENLLINLPSVR
jgi:DNA polymerase III subunit delta'